MIFKRRILSLIIKEFIVLLQDKKSRAVLIGPPIIQLLIFAHAATLEVKNVSLAIYNQDSGRHGYEVVQRLQASPTFTKITFVDHIEAMTPLIDNQRVLAAIHIPQDFSRDLESGQIGKIQIILDGRKSNAAQIVSAYLGQIVNAYGTQILAKKSHL